MGWLKFENTNCFANLLPRSLQQDPGHRWTNLRNGELKDFFCCFHVFRAPHLLEKNIIVAHYLKLWMKPKNSESVQIRGVYHRLKLHGSELPEANLKKTRRLWDRRLLSCNRCAPILLKKVAPPSIYKENFQVQTAWQLSLRKWPCSEHHFSIWTAWCEL